MSEMKWAIITGADGGMGTEITRAVAKAGYRIIMACYHPKKAEVVRERLSKETGNPDLEVMALDLSSMQSVISFVSRISERNLPIALLMNNAGTMETGFHTTSEGFERTVSVNYIGPYLLTRKLIPLMVRGARIVNMVSCTYAIGKLDFPDFFHRGKTGTFWRISVYSNTKLALLLFTFELSEQLREKRITVNAADPGIVSTNMITMHAWFDPLTDILFRPFIKTAAQGAATAIYLAQSPEVDGKSGGCYANCKEKKLPERILHHPLQRRLWDDTEALLLSRNLLNRKNIPETVGTY